MVALLLPYGALLVARTGRAATPSWLALAVGVLAGCGLCLKPHFVIGWIAMEMAARAGGLRSLRRAEVAGVLAVQAAYVIAALPILPAYIAVAREFGGAYQAFWHVSPWALLLTEPTTPMVVAALGLAAIHYPTMADPYRAWARIVGALTAASYLVALMQAKGWPYHFYPPQALSLLLLYATAAEFLSRSRATTVVSALAGGLVLGLSIASGFAAFIDDAVRLNEPSPGARLVSAVREVSRPGERIVVFNFGMQAAFPTIPVARLENASRWPTQWVLMAAYPVPMPWRAPAAMPPFERSYFTTTVEDLTRHPPDLLVAPVPDPAAPTFRGFDFLGYFAQDEHFASLLERYDRVTTVSGHRILRRRDSGWHAPSVPSDMGGTFDDVLSESEPPTRRPIWQAVAAALVVTAMGWLWPRRRVEPTHEP